MGGKIMLRRDVLTNGIDVSQYQGLINWEVVKNHIDFAIIRCGYGQDIIGQDDELFKRNADECTRLNIPFGVYLYSYAKNVEDARGEARHVMRLVKDYKMAYPGSLTVIIEKNSKSIDRCFVFCQLFCYFISYFFVSCVIIFIYFGGLLCVSIFLNLKIMNSSILSGTFIITVPVLLKFIKSLVRSKIYALKKICPEMKSLPGQRIMLRN